MNTLHSRRSRLAGVCAAFVALTLTSASATAAANSGPDAATAATGNPTVSITGGAIHGISTSWGFAFRGIPYAAPPIGRLRWRPPQPPVAWQGVRDGTRFAPSCPQAASPFVPPGRLSEDCLYLNVSTPTLRHSARRPVLVWIHGGGFTQDAARNYDGSELARTGLVVVTINYRLGALGFLAHPALAARPGGSTGNYGLMDQQAALRWVRLNIARFGGDPGNVTIAGQSAGGVSVLAQMVSRGARGLFQRAVVQSGAFALHQQSLADAEAAGEAFAAKAGCLNQTARCLRHLPVADLVTPGSAIPGVVDGKVITESIGTALRQGRFARVPILNGIVHNEEWLFVAGLGVAVSNGTFVPVPSPVTPESYTSTIATVLGVSQARAQAIAAEYPPATYGAPVVALSTLLSDANFACPALQVDRWTSRRVRTFGYQFNDDNAPQRFTPPDVLPPIATHSSEIQYLFGQPNLPFPGTFTTDQKVLARHMRAAWASFAATGNPSTGALGWPSIAGGARVMSLVAPRPQVENAYSADHHCAFWAAG
jgi:para-nitrobenzyl esterase